MAFGLGKKLKKAARGLEKGLRGGLNDITGKKDLKKASGSEAQRLAAERRLAMFQQARDTRKLIEETRIGRASLIARSVSEGIGEGSSALEGALSSQRTQVAESISANKVETEFGLAAAKFGSDANRSRSRAAEKQATTSTVLSIGGAIAGL
jgi:hypothetical protein